MFRFVHAADIHLDSPLRGLSRYETAPAEAIRNASRGAFESLVDLAIEESVSFVLLAGDLFDGDWKDFNTGIFMSRQLGRLSRAGIHVLAVAGNHDAVSQVTKALTLPENMRFFPTGRPGTERLDHIAVAVHGQGFKTRHVDENLAAGFPPAESGMFNIGLLHTSLDGREGHADYAPCSLDDLRSRGYQYWALGHSHQYEVVAEDPFVVFPGCIQGRHIREIGPKGCALVTVEDGLVASVEPRELDRLRWASCSVDLTDVTGMDELLERTRNVLVQARLQADGRFLAVRLRLEGATPLADELAAHPERVEQQVRAQGAEVGADELWIEKVVSRVTRKMDLTQVLEAQGAWGAQLDEILSAPEGVDAVEGLHELLVEFRRKLPPEAVSSETGLDISQADVIARLVREARELLVGRLLVEEEGR